MDSIAIGIGGLAVGGLVTFLVETGTDWRRERTAKAEARLQGAAVAKIVSDELWGIETVLREAINDKRWWLPQLDVRLRITSEEYRFLAIVVDDWHDFNRVAMAVRRLRRLAIDRDAVGSVPLRPAVDEQSAGYIQNAYDSCEQARQALSRLSGIQFAPHDQTTHDPRLEADVPEIG